MPISSLVNKKVYTSSNVSAEYAFSTFTIYESGDLAVYSINSSGAESLLTETTDYTVALDGTAPNTGVVTLIAAFPTGGKIVLKRKPAIDQDINYSDGVGTPASVQNKAIDKLTMICQSLQEEVDRCVKTTVDNDEPGDAIDWTSVIASGSITAVMLNADVTTLINSLISAGTSSFVTSSTLSSAIAGFAQKGTNTDITSLTGCGAVSPSSGDLTFAPTSGDVIADTASGANLSVYNSGAVGITLANGGAYAIEVINADSTSGNFVVFHDADSVVGTISFSSNTTAYNTSSDERLKSNIEDFNAIDIVRLMKPKKYNRVKGGNKKEYGFIAQKLYEVVPEAVTVGGDDVKSSPWMIDQTKLIPILAQAIIELDKENDKLRKRIKKVETFLNLNEEQR